MKTFYTHNSFTALCFFIAVFAFTSRMDAANRTASVSGNWNVKATWGGAAVPVAGDAVTINNGVTVSVTAPASCTTISFPTNNATTTTININTGITLTVSGAITIPRSSAGFNQINVGSGILNAGSIAFTNGGAANKHQITISSGTVTVTGNVTQTGSTGSATISFSGAGTLNLGGNFYTSTTGTLTTFAGCTVNYNGAGAQTVSTFTYSNLTLLGSGIKTAGGIINTTTLDNGGSTILNMQGFTLNASIIDNTGGTIQFGGSSNGKAILTGTVEYTGSTQTITTGTYATLYIIGGGGIKTVNGDISVTTLDNGGLSNIATILDMGTNNLTATSIENTNATIKFGGLTNGKAISTGTVEYYGTTQTITTGTYATINISATGTKTAGGNISATSLDNGGLNDSATILDMIGNTLNVTTIENTNGTIKFSGLNNGKAITTGIVEYYGVTQTVASGTYGSLNISTAGTKTASNTLTVNGSLTTATGAILDMTTYQLLGNLTSIVNDGTIKTAYQDMNWRIPIPSGKIWGGIGTVEYSATNIPGYDGGQGIVAGTYNNLTTSGFGNKWLQGDITVLGDIVISAPTILNVNNNNFWSNNNYDIYLSGDFTNNGSFNEQQKTVIFNSTSNDQIIGGSTITDFYDFNVNNNGNSVILNKAININHKLTFSTTGFIELGLNTLTINSWSNGDIVGLSSDRYVIWNGGKFIINGVGNGETIQFPVGLSKASTDYARVDITNHDASQTTFEYTSVYNYLNSEGTSSGGNQITTKGVDLTYNITSASTNADITLYWDVSKELPLFTRNLSQVQHHNGTKWELKGVGGPATQMGTSTIYSRIATGVTSFSPYAVGDQDTPLPIELLEFNANVRER